MMMRAMLGAVAAVAWLGCGGTAAEVAPEPEPEVATPARQAPVHDPHLERVESEVGRVILGAFMAEADAGGRAWTVVEATSVSNATDALLVSRAGEGTSCTQTYAVAEVGHDDQRVDVRLVGADCCDALLCRRDAAGWMIHLWRKADDFAALSEVVTPAGGLEVTIVTVDDGDEVVETKRTLTRADVASEGFGGIAPPAPLFMTTSCVGQIGGTTVCTSGAGGIHQEWTWRVDGTRATLMSVSESSH